MNNLISVNKVVELTSLDIAKLTGKQHSHVIRDIKIEIEVLGQSIGESIFELGHYITSQNKSHPCYTLTENGIKNLARKYKLTQEQMNKLGIDDIDVVYNHTRFEVSFLNMLEEMLEEIDIIGERQFNIDGYRLDFYIKDLNIAVEYDEEQHYISKNMELDLERQVRIESKIGCKFIRCDYKISDAKNCMKIIKKIMGGR